MGQMNKKRIGRISIFIISIFVILFSVTYAFITQTLTGTKEVVINAGTLDLVLEEENAITISDALPMYDEVGMIQEPFTFRLVNNGSNPVNYKLSLVDVTLQSLERKCSDLGEITLDSPVGCRETIYPEELRKEALAFCQMTFDSNITTESDCVSTVVSIGAPFNTFEGFIDYFIVEGVFEDTRTLGNTYPDNVVDIPVQELYHEYTRYGLTKNEENTIGSISDMEYTWKIDDPELRAKTLEICKNWYPEVTDEDSCIAANKVDGNDYKTFDDIVGDLFQPNGGKRFTLYSGIIGANETINYNLRLWISENVENIREIKGMTFSFKIDVEVSQKIEYVQATSTEKIVDSAVGDNCKTYNDGTETFLVGQCPNNYVWYSGKLWRVVLKNNETGTVKMVTENAITSISYNASGNPAFKDSYVDQWLTQEFLPTLNDYENYLVTDSIWDATENSSNTPTRPSYTTSITRTVGLLNSYEHYITYTKYGDLWDSTERYLSIVSPWWLMTPCSTSNVCFNNGVSLVESTTDFNYAVRPAVYLKSNIQISGGSGVKNDPYILEGDIQEPLNGTTLLNTRYSGDHITFNGELYRIVGVENGLTKITAVKKPSALSSNMFNSNGSTSFASSSIKNDLEKYYQELKTTNEVAYNMIEPDTIWYLGAIADGVNYKSGMCASVVADKSMNDCSTKATSTTASIGLPRLGEMFTSQISSREEIDEFWTLTPYMLSYVRYVNYNNSMKFEYPTNNIGARPSMYLKSNVVIARDNTGNGTYQKPYTIELGQ